MLGGLLRAHPASVLLQSNSSFSREDVGAGGAPSQPGRSRPSVGRACHGRHVPSLWGWPRPREDPDTSTVSWSGQVREEEAEEGGGPGVGRERALRGAWWRGGLWRPWTQKEEGGEGSLGGSLAAHRPH